MTIIWKNKINHSGSKWLSPILKRKILSTSKEPLKNSIGSDKPLLFTNRYNKCHRFFSFSIEINPLFQSNGWAVTKKRLIKTKVLFAWRYFSNYWMNARWVAELTIGSGKPSAIPIPWNQNKKSNTTYNYLTNGRKKISLPETHRKQKKNPIQVDVREENPTFCTQIYKCTEYIARQCIRMLSDLVDEE